MEFACSVCQYTSDRKHCVKKHINRVNKCGENPQIVEIPIEIKCEHCQKQYSTKPNLIGHYKICKFIKEQSTKPQFNFDEHSMNFIYLLMEREFIKTNEHIFKIGYTSKDILARTNGYPKGSKIFCVFPVANNPELKLISQFKKTFIHRKDIGNEYFEGNFQEMFTTLYELIYTQ